MSSSSLEDGGSCANVSNRAGHFFFDIFGCFPTHEKCPTEVLLTWGFRPPHGVRRGVKGATTLVLCLYVVLCSAERKAELH